MPHKCLFMHSRIYKTGEFIQNVPGKSASLILQSLATSVLKDSGFLRSWSLERVIP